MSEDDVEVGLSAPDDRPTTPDAPNDGVVVASEVLDQMDAHVGEDTTVEYGGVMVGHVDDAGTTVVVGSIRAEGAISETASLRFTHETWDHVNDVLERDFEGSQMVGWYHSHPHYGVFLSEHDLFIHRNFFSQPWQVAYVRDPLLDQRGFFAWVGGDVVEIDDWRVAAEPDELPPAGTTPVAGEAEGRERAASPAETRRERAPGRVARRSELWMGVVAMVVLAVPLFLAFRIVWGGDDGASAPTIEFVAEDDAIGSPGEEVTVGVVRLVDEDFDESYRLSKTDAISTEPDGGQLPIDWQVPETGQWVIVAAVPEDAVAGTYEGTAVVQVCAAGTECDESSPSSNQVRYTVAVEDAGLAQG